jgi:hypothetical protein
MKKERDFEFKFADTVPLAEHLALLCQMLQAAENAESTAEEAVELAEPVAV